MKKFYRTIRFRGVLKLLATLLLFLTLFSNVNAQVMTANSIKAPAVITSVGAFKPGVITGSNVTITDAGGSTCSGITYEWVSATNAEFTENVQHNLAATKDYDPGVVATTTYFRRLVSVRCTDPIRGTNNRTGSVKITIQ